MTRQIILAAGRHIDTLFVAGAKHPKVLGLFRISPLSSNGHHKTRPKTSGADFRTRPNPDEHNLFATQQAALLLEVEL